jgi:hypothetical protein
MMETNTQFLIAHNKVLGFDFILQHCLVSFNYDSFTEMYNEVYAQKY